MLAIRSLRGVCRLRQLAAMLVITGSALASSAASAATQTWQVASGDWNTASNWAATLPGASDTALIDNGRTASITQMGPICNMLALGDSSGAGTVNMTAGSLNVGFELYCGQSGAGTFLQSGGTATASYDAYLGYNTGSNGSYNLSGGSLTVSVVLSVGTSGTGTFVQSGGTNSVGFWLAVGDQPTGVGSYNLSGGSLWSGEQYVGSSGSGTLVQSGGTNSASYLYLGSSSSGTGTYNLSGGSLSSQWQYVGNPGTGVFMQSGGANSVSSRLGLGYASGSSGTYGLSGSGSLWAASEYIGYNPSATALFAQSGGTNSTSYLSIGSGGRYLLAGGTLQLGAYLSSGTLDGGNAAGALNTAPNTIVDLSQGAVANTSATVLNVGQGSLLILPAGTSAANFGTINGPGMYYTRGTPLVVPPGSGFEGTWTISDPVVCQGSIQANEGSLNLAVGLSISGTGSVNLGSGALTTQDATSGISGGSLSASYQYLAPSGTGVFTQSGGESTISNLTIGGGGRYVLSGGTLQIPQGGLALAGTLDGGNMAGNLNVAGSGVVDLSQGSFANTESMSLSIGQDSLLILSSTMNPALLFGQFSNAGMIHISGSTLTVSAGTGFAGAGAISDPVVCQGSITAAGGPLSFPGGLTISGNGKVNLGSGTLAMESAPATLSGGSLFASFHCVGLTGTSTFMQSGGTNSSSNVYVGYYSTSSGTYNLAGGVLSASSQNVGYSGTGTLAQSGGANNPNYLYLGNNPSSVGSYILSGSGFLNTVSGEYIGYSGTGSFNQSQGTNSVFFGPPFGGFYLGYNSGSSGTYTLSGGSLWASTEYVGYSGAGSFSQSQGTNSTNQLFLGNSGGSGSYTLSGGSLLGGTEYVGNAGNCTFSQSGGANRPYAVYLGNTAGLSGTASYNLSGGLLATTYEYLSYYGAGAFTQSGGTNSTSYLYLGQSNVTSASYNLSGGSLSAANEYVGYSNSFGAGFTQSGGTNSAGSGALYVGYNSGQGVYSLSGGSLFAPNEYLGYSSGEGTLTQSGGTNSIPGGLYLGNTFGRAKYILSGGLLAMGGFSSAGVASFVFSGGTLEVMGSPTIGVPISLPISGSNATFDTVGNSVVLSGLLTGPGGIIKAGSGALALNAADSYLGNTTILGGTLSLGNALALVDSTVNLVTGGTLNLNNYNAALGGLSGNGNLALGNANVTLQVGFNSTSTTYSGSLSGTGNLQKTGKGTLTLAGSNGYTGNTSIIAGTLDAATTAAVPNLLVASPKVSVTASATLAVGVGGPGEWTSANIDTLRAKSGVFASGANLGFDTSGGSFAYSSNIANAGLGLVKLGANTLVLSGTNTYSGGTTVTAGELEISNPWSLPNDANVYVGAGAAEAFAPAEPAAIGSAVPEPATIPLFAAAAAVVAGSFRGFGRRRFIAACAQRNRSRCNW
jgi:fibronectin-binding autotransporter adhesin